MKNKLYLVILLALFIGITTSTAQIDYNSPKGADMRLDLGIGLNYSFQSHDHETYGPYADARLFLLVPDMNLGMNIHAKFFPESVVVGAEAMFPYVKWHWGKRDRTTIELNFAVGFFRNQQWNNEEPEVQDDLMYGLDARYAYYIPKVGELAIFVRNRQFVVESTYHFASWQTEVGIVYAFDVRSIGK